MRLNVSLCLSRVRIVLLLALLGATFDATAAAATLTVCAAGCTYTVLQQALEAAHAGDVILLRAGETFVGNFVLPAKGGPAGLPIVIRSDAPDGTFPPVDTRLVPIGYPDGNTDRRALARLVG